MKTEKLASNAADGLILLHKNQGLTSFESLGFIKKALSTRKAGHTGTLDKFASGLLIVLTGHAVKLASLFSYCKKEYEGRIRFGIETDTLDPEGAIIGEAEIPSLDTVEKILADFTGEILQSPPAYSAVHLNGKRAYELARQGQTPEIKKRPVTIYSLELASWEPPFASIKVCCSAGTYIRSLARDIALAAKSRAHLNALVRTKIGSFNLSDAFDPAKFSIGNFDNFSRNIAEMREAVVSALHPITPDIFSMLNLPWVCLENNLNGEEQIRAISYGQSLDNALLNKLINNLPYAPAAGIFANISDKVEIIALLEQLNSKWKYAHVFN